MILNDEIAEYILQGDEYEKALYKIGAVFVEWWTKINDKTNCPEMFGTF